MSPEFVQQLSTTLQSIGPLPPGSVIVVVPPRGNQETLGGAFQGAPVAIAPDTETARIEHLVHSGDEAKPLAEWGRELDGVSARELQRANKHGALETSIRESGSGHGAVEAAPSAILRYLQTCEAVQRGRIDAPAWWMSVRRGSNGSIDG